MVATDMEELNDRLKDFVKPSEKPIILEVFTDADNDAKALKEYWCENREEIPGIKISTKARIKRIVKRIFGNNVYKIKRLLKK